MRLRRLSSGMLNHLRQRNSIVMAKKKLAKVQDIPGMKIYNGPDGPEMYTTDKRFSRGSDWLELMIEAKMKCRKVKITYLESPGAKPQTLVVAPYKQIQSVNGWEIEDLPAEGAACRRYSLQNITEACLTDEMFEEPDLIY